MKPSICSSIRAVARGISSSRALLFCSTTSVRLSISERWTCGSDLTAGSTFRGTPKSMITIGRFPRAVLAASRCVRVRIGSGLLTDVRFRPNALANFQRRLEQSIQYTTGRPVIHGHTIRFPNLAEDFRLPQQQGIQPGCNAIKVTNEIAVTVAVDG